MNKNLLKVSLLFVMTCFFGIHAFAQAKADWEMLGSTSNPTTGQTLAATATMAYNSGNPSNNDVINFPNPLQTTVTLKNHQFDWGSQGRTKSNVIAGSGGTVLNNLGYLGTPSKSMYTSNGAAAGTGIDIANNQAFVINNYTAPLRQNKIPTLNRTYIGDLEITFNRPVNNPIVHLAGLGGNALNNLNFSTEFDLLSTNVRSASLSKLSGNDVMIVTNNQINNNATTMNGTNGAASGSVQVNGSGITTITFKMYLRGDKDSSSDNWASSDTAVTSTDGFTLSVSAVEDMGYIYVHKKAVSEVASVDFDYTLAGTSGSSFLNFKLNDKPDSVGNAFDLGNSHGAGEGQLWAVIQPNNNSQDVHVVTGTLYTRPIAAPNWIATTVTNARSVDGIGSGTAIYSDELGAVYLYDSGSTKIWDPANHSGVKILDVASGGTGKVLAAVGDDGKIYKYAGNGSNDTWQVFTNVVPDLSGANPLKAYRIDVLPSTEDIYFIRTSGSGNIWKVPSANPATATPIILYNTPSGGNAVSDNSRDIAVSNDGTVFSTYSEAIYWRSPTGNWVTSKMTRRLYGLTGGSGDQAWGINKNNSTLIEHSIYTKATAPVPAGEEAVWLDDERVRTNFIGNSIMIPVPAGTYKLSEIDNAAWNNNYINIYDPTNNSSYNLANSESTINVATGEVVNVVYTNALKNQVNVPNVCTTNYVVTFGGNASSPTNGPAINGFTSYHYRYDNNAADGYYIITKNNSGWWGGPPTTNLRDHSVDASGNPVNGYFAIFNASYSKDDFFRQTVTGLVPGVVYELAFWVADVGDKFSIRPNVTMGIFDPATGQEMATPINTGDISATQWKRYSAQFTATAATAEIYLRNNSVGGNGNDLAIDDISFAPAPPPLPPIQAPAGFTIACSSKSSNPDQYQFTIANPGSSGTGVWSTDNTNLITINPTTGLATAVYGKTGKAEVIYRFTSNTGCMSETKLEVNIGNCVCNNPVTNFGTPNKTKHGITLLKRAGGDDNQWPMNRPSAHTVLESNTKGFVPTRISKNDLETVKTITNPQEGMMVYDTTDKCLKIYSDGAWKCFNTQTCP